MGTVVLAGDFLNGPGTGALGGPPVQHNYKRAVCRAAPHDFSVEVLPPAKFGNGYCYGMRIYPILGSEIPDDKSGQSSNSGGSMHKEYDIWRRWDDCLWFQEILESEYALMARTKRQRLAAGKGVKKNGVYIHSDQAASFDSLPPGPEANSIAKDIHDIIPKLTKKGTFFRASQATIEQRGREFRAMIETLFSDGVPTLVNELRETRLVHDFFGYWRRDRDRERKGVRPSSSGGDTRGSVAGSTLSMYFSASTISLQLPSSPLVGPATSTPHRPVPSSSSQGLGRSPTGKYVPSELTVAPPSIRSISPSQQSPPLQSPSQQSSPLQSTSPRSPKATSLPLQFSVTDRGSLALQSADSDDGLHADNFGVPRNISSIMSLRWSRSPMKTSVPSEPKTRVEDVPVLFMPDGQPWSETALNEHHIGLQALPEDQVLVPEMSSVTIGTGGPRPQGPRALVRRSRKNSHTDQANRNCVVYMPIPASSATENDDAAAEMPPSDPSTPPMTPNNTMISSSRPSSMTSSTFSDVSRRSSWRTSVASEMSIAAGFSSSFARDSGIDIDCSPAHCHTRYVGSHMTRASIATMNSLVSGTSVDAVLPRKRSPPPSSIDEELRRPLSAGSQWSSSALSDASAPAEEIWYEQDDLLDTYFYEPGLPPVSPVESAFHLEQDRPSRQFDKHMSSPERFPKPFQDRPAGQFHVPWSRPDSSQSTIVASRTGTFTLKAMLNESIVLLRVAYSMPFLEVRERIRDKFANQEGMPLSDTFVIAYLPLADRAKTRQGRARSNSCSTLGSDRSQPLRYIASDEEWKTAVAGSSSKLTVRIFHARP